VDSIGISWAWMVIWGTNSYGNIYDTSFHEPLRPWGSGVKTLPNFWINVIQLSYVSLHLSCDESLVFVFICRQLFKCWLGLMCFFLAGTSQIWFPANRSPLVNNQDPQNQLYAQSKIWFQPWLRPIRLLFWDIWRDGFWDHRNPCF